MSIIDRELKAAVRRYIKDRISYTSCTASNGNACESGNDACFFYDDGRCDTGRIKLLRRGTFYEERTDGETDLGIYIG